MGTSKVLYRAEGIPAMQNKLFTSRDEALMAPTASLELTQDETGLVFNRKFDPDSVLYDDSYQNDQGFSPQFQAHLAAVSELCCGYLKSKDSLVVDVGCGKGGFVELLRIKGFNAIGFDNSYQGASPYIRKAFFSSDSHEKGDLLTLRHVLEHIPSPWDFLDAIAVANDYKGFLYIEVPDLEWILENRAYFDLFNEHVNYFRVGDFYCRYGDCVVFASKSFEGQYLSVVIDLERLRSSYSPPQRESNQNLSTAFGQLSQYEKTTYTSLLDWTEVVIWGAGAKGVVFAAKAPSIIKSKIKLAIDINPSKQDCYMPTSGIQVLDPSLAIPRINSSCLVIIMNPNYEREIRKCLPSNQSCLVIN